MIAFDYLYRGLCGLANAHRANTMAGHLGAAVIAGYFIGEEQPDLHPDVAASIEANLDRIIAGEEGLWFNPQAAGVTVAELFEPLPETEPRPERIGIIAEALSANIDRLRQSGHNVIFTSIALRALQDHPRYATSEMIEGIRRLIAGFGGAPPGRGYYGRDRGWLTGDQVTLEENDLPAYESRQELADFVIAELITAASLRRRGFGGLFHLLNHAAGLSELSDYGYEELAARGLAAHRHHARLWRSLPDVSEELGELEPAEHDPRTPGYWQEEPSTQWSAHLTHRIKTLYGFFTLLRHIDDAAARANAERRFLYLMG